MLNPVEFNGAEIEIPGSLPILPLRDVVAFPDFILPLFVGRERSAKAVEYAIKNDKVVFLTAQRDLNIKDPAVEDLFTIGTIAIILRMMRVPEQGDKMKVLVQGLCKGRILDFIQTQPFLIAAVEKEEKEKSDIKTADAEHLIAAVKEKVDKLVFNYGKKVPADILVVIENLEDSEKLAHLVAANIGLDVSQAQEILEIGNPTQKLIRVGEILDEQIGILKGEKERKEHIE
jgi:ATP-dependent Lon protease